tara:strand:- start:847 stop:1185 length:339 start_codon:yes stop_codon:yes gene_type:complete
MSHYARIEDGVVLEVIVSSYDHVETLEGNWIRTSYNMVGGVHTRGLQPLRFNFAGVGYIYDSVRDAFYTPQPYTSWSLNENTCLWEAPVDMPTDGNIYDWDELSLTWLQYTP